ncbi:MAG: hypothetical protein Greene07147_223 [Parcubacteria group bacterium Greene0714_7]|nr:MAG: hypothetical protein Greene07147_223 [Parcubacteria group bacterium Greene0714_7]
MWTVPVSNRLPPHCKCGALPIELTALTEKESIIQLFVCTLFEEGGRKLCLQALDEKEDSIRDSHMYLSQ